MLLSNVVLIARIGEVDSGLIEFLAWHCTLLKKFLPAAVNLFLSIEQSFGRLEIEAGLLKLFGNSRSCGRGVGSLRLVVSAFCILRRCRQIAILQRRQ